MPREVSAATIERLRQLMLDDRGRSCLQASVELGLSDTAASCAMSILHKRGLVFIEKYERAAHAANWVRIFKFGVHRDAAKPKSTESYTHAYQRREREYLKESRSSGSKVFRHPHDVAFFGECAALPKPSIFQRQVYCQSMEIDDEEMAA